MSNSVKSEMESVVRESASPVNVVDYLSGEQRAALESKFNTLDQDIRSACAAKYPGKKTAELFAIRTLVKMANSALASQHRPVWFYTLNLNATSLQSSDKTVAEYAEKQLRELAEELDTKESVTILKKYKVSKDMTSENPHIIRLCGIFGIENKTLK